MANAREMARLSAMRYDITEKKRLLHRVAMFVAFLGCEIVSGSALTCDACGQDIQYTKSRDGHASTSAWSRPDSAMGSDAAARQPFCDSSVWKEVKRESVFFCTTDRAPRFLPSRTFSSFCGGSPLRVFNMKGDFSTHRATPARLWLRVGSVRNKRKPPKFLYTKNL